MRLYMKLAIQGAGRDEQGKYKLDWIWEFYLLRDPSCPPRPKFASGVFAPENPSEDEHNDDANEDSDMEINLAKFVSGKTAAARRQPPTSGFAHFPMTVIPIFL